MRAPQRLRAHSVPTLRVAPRRGLSKPDEFRAIARDHLLDQEQLLQRKLPRRLMVLGRPSLPTTQFSDTDIRLVEEELSRQIGGLSLLLKHFKIKTRPDSLHWQLLCFDLARTQVPYFKSQIQSRGHQKFWTDDERVNLYVSVRHEVLLNRRPTIDDALAALIVPQWSRYNGRDLKVDSLRQRYKEACRLVRDKPEFALLVKERLRSIKELSPYSVAAPKVQITER